MTKPVYIVDTTLRDGEQAPGVVFSVDEKLKIAGLLDEIGIPELEIGSPAISSTERQDLKAIVQAGFSFRTSCWCRAVKQDIDYAFETGSAGVNISYPVSTVQLEAIGKSKEWVLSELPHIVKYAQGKFEYVSIGAQDASRAESDFLHEYIALAADLDIYRVRIADTVGVLNPFSTADLIKNIAQNFPELTLEFHAHNDLGMATANAVSAVMAGVQAVSTTVNGLGERAGNAAMEEFLFALKKSTDVELPYLYNKLIPLSEFVYEASNRDVPVSKPIVGSMVLKHETGIHTRSILSNPKSYELFDEVELGRKSDFVFGKFSGKASIAHLFAKKGISVCSDGISKILAEIKYKSALHKRSYTSHEVIAMFKSAVR